MGGRTKKSQATAEAPAEKGRLDAGSNCPIVGVGASAGGLDAFKRLLEATPKDPGFALVLVQHLDPDHESLMAELLSRCTDLPVVQAENATRVEPNHVYVIPPKNFIKLHKGGLFLEEPVKKRGVRMPIDYFFRSLAEERGERGIGVVLSGTGSDGTLGLKEIKARGGLVVVQDPATAEYDGMPRSAFAAQVVDIALPIEEIPAAILRYIAHPYIERDKTSTPFLLDTDPASGRALVNLLRAHTDYDFRCYKKGTLGRRVQRRMGLRQVESLADYVKYVRSDPEEIRLLFKDLLINVTAFFREPDAWNALQAEVVAPLVARTPAAQPIRVWVPGCATGEEAYTMAILFHEEFRRQGRRQELQLFATDLDEDAIRVAREAVYPRNAGADISQERLGTFFQEDGGHQFRVKREIRDCVVFAVQNLIGDPPFSGLDIISCRNVMIYLEPQTQARLIQMFHFALKEDGILFVGGSEGVGGDSKYFEPLSKPARIYKRKRAPTAGGIEIPQAPSQSQSHSGRTHRVSQPGVSDMARAALLERYAPPSVLVNRKFEIQYFHGVLRDFLDIPPGMPTTDLMAMGRDGLTTRLRRTVQSAIREGKHVTAVAPRVRRGDGHVSVRIEAEPVRSRDDEPLILVTFADVEESPGSVTGAGNETGTSTTDDAAAPLVEQLEDELRSTREDLQGTIEELESSNEELKASNEEVLSMNEEFQSTNEELETSREELQSLNEELSTVNSQLEDKVDEVERTSDDLRNLLTSTEIAAIFLDTEFRIRRFTPATEDLLHVIATDVGRPISDLAPRFKDSRLYPDARKVLRSLAPVERKVQLRPPASEDAADRAEAQWFIRRILPFRTGENRIDGVVVTYTNVSELQSALSGLRRRERQAATVAHLGRFALSIESIDDFLEEVIEQITRTLDVEFSKVLHREDSGAFRLRAGRGWKDGADGSVVRGGLDSQAGYTVQAAAPVIVEDLASERRFSGPPLLREHGVVSGISVPIGTSDRPWGVLGVHTTTRRQFTVDDGNFLQSVANLLWDALDTKARNDVIRYRERQLQLVTDAMPVLISYCSSDVRYRYCNARYEELFGVHRDEILGRHVREVIGRAAFEKVEPYVERVLAGERVSVRQHLAYRHGPERDVRVEYIPDLGNDGEVLGYFAMIEDVSARTQSERMQALLASIVESSGDAITGKDLEGRVTTWNPAAERMYGWTEEEMIGQPLTRITPPGREHEVGEIIARLQRGERVEGLETTRVARDGTRILVSLTSSPVLDQDGEMVGVSSFARDVSDRVEREQALAASETRLQLAKDAARLGIIDYDLATGTLTCDARMRKILGFSESEEITPEALLECVDAEDRGTVQEMFAEMLRPGSRIPIEGEYRVTCRDSGEVAWVEARALAAFDGDRPTRLIGAALDVTDRRVIEESLRHADERKDEFLAMLGHELRNPLGALVNSIACLRQGVDGAPEIYDAMARQAALMTTLLNDLLDIGRITRGDITLRLEPTRLSDVIQGAIKMVRPEADAAGHEIITRLSPDDLEFVVDPVRLEQVLVNLLTNAVRFTGRDGRIEVDSHVRGDRVVITITDDGVGLSKADQRRVFNLFFQSRKGVGGLGIGLSLVRSLVELHGGRVSVSSDGHKKGTTFRVTLPSDLIADEPEESETPMAVRPDLSDLRVLVVDDHLDLLSSLNDLLKNHCRVGVASSGDEALELVRSFEPDVILMDLSMPGMNGFELLEALRDVPEAASAERIALTGFGDAKTAELVSKSQFSGQLIKPVDPDTVLDLLASIKRDRDRAT